MNYYVYIQGYKRNNKLYLYVGSHCHSDNEGFYDYKGSGSVLADGFEWVTKHILQYYDSIEEMYAGEVYWIRRFAEKFGVSGWVFRHYKDHDEVTDFVKNFYHEGGLLLNAKDTTDAPLQSTSAVNNRFATQIERYGVISVNSDAARQIKIERYGSITGMLNTPEVQARARATSTERYSEMAFGGSEFTKLSHTDDANKQRCNTNTERYGSPMGQCHTPEIDEARKIKNWYIYDSSWNLITKEPISLESDAPKFVDASARSRWRYLDKPMSFDYKPTKGSHKGETFHFVHISIDIDKVKEDTTNTKYNDPRARYWLLSDGSHGSLSDFNSLWGIKHAYSRLYKENKWLERNKIDIVSSRIGQDFTDEEIQQLLQN